MTDKSKRKETPQTFRQKYGMLLVAGVCLLFLCCMLAQHSFVQNTLYDEYYPKLFVPYVGYGGDFFLIIAVSFCLIPPFFIIIAVSMTLYKIYKHQSWQNFVTLLILIGCVATFFMLVTWTMFSDGINIRHRTIINGQTYYVAALHSYDNMGFAPYGIYECDDAEFRCLLVFTDIPGSHLYYHVDVTSDDKQIMVEITYDNETEIYIYRPD